jgi:hypothetical protein
MEKKIMANNTKNKGQFAPVSKHPVVSEMEKSAHLTGAVLASTMRFAAIFMCAVALGFLLDWADKNCEFFPKWGIQLGHLVEYGIYVLDIVGYCWSVGLHFVHYMASEWHEFRDSFKKPH